ncbi:MAG: hypothetical protein ACI8RD_010560, partial [Bacillariaceae sp.]
MSTRQEQNLEEFHTKIMDGIATSVFASQKRI